MKPVPKKITTRNSQPEDRRYSRWIRFYTDVINDPKVQLLDAYTFKVWVNLLALAGQHERGHLPAIVDIAFRLRMSVHDAQSQVNALIDVGLIDILTRSGDTITLQPHNWCGRQFKSDNETSAERTRKWREKNNSQADVTAGDVPCDVTVTSPRQFPSESALHGREDSLSKNSVGEGGGDVPECDVTGTDGTGPTHDLNDDDEIPL